MATQVKHRRGTQSEIDAFTGAIGEIVVNTTEEELILNNGATQGGIPIPKKRNTQLSFDTLLAAVGNTSLKAGYSIELKERTSGNGGGLWDVVTGTGSANGFNIVAHDTLDISLVLRDKTGEIDKYGAVANTDVTDVVQHVADLLGLVSFPANTASTPYIIKDISTTIPTVFIPKSGKSFIKMGTPSFVSSSMVSLNNNSCFWDWGLKVNGDGQSRSAIFVSDGSNNCEVNIDATNINADDISDTNNAFPAALNVGAVDNLTFSARGRDFQNTGHSNESVPRVVTLRGDATNFEARFIKSESVDGSTILSATSTGTIDLLDVDRCGDNGLYAGGGEIYIGDFIYRGNQEALVVLGGADIRIGTMYVIGEGSYAVNLQDHKAVEIGNLIIDFDDQGNSISGLMRTRNGNVKAGTLRIGSVMGAIAGSRLIAFDTGILETLSIDNIDVEFHYDPAKVTNPSLWANFAACEEVHIGRMNIKVITPTLTSSLTLELKGLGNLTRASYLENLTVDYYKATGGRDTLGFFRGDLAVEHMRGRAGNSWRTSIGPFVKEVSDDWVDGIASGAAPTAGYWYKGTDLVIGSQTLAPFRARCTVSGSPGTWVTY
jgi:hypothetical protein